MSEAPHASSSSTPSAGCRWCRRGGCTGCMSFWLTTKASGLRRWSSGRCCCRGCVVIRRICLPLTWPRDPEAVAWWTSSPAPRSGNAKAASCPTHSPPSSPNRYAHNPLADKMAGKLSTPIWYVDAVLWPRDAWPLCLLTNCNPEAKKTHENHFVPNELQQRHMNTSWPFCSTKIGKWFSWPQQSQNVANPFQKWIPSGTRIKTAYFPSSFRMPRGDECKGKEAPKPTSSYTKGTQNMLFKHFRTPPTWLMTCENGHYVTCPICESFVASWLLAVINMQAASREPQICLGPLSDPLGSHAASICQPSASQQASPHCQKFVANIIRPLHIGLGRMDSDAGQRPTCFNVWPRTSRPQNSVGVGSQCTRKKQHEATVTSEQ